MSIQTGTLHPDGTVTDQKTIDLNAKSSVTYPNGRNLRGRMKWRFLSGDCNWQDHGGSFHSKLLFHGDFHFRYVIAVCRLPDGDEDYCVQLSVVSPEAVPMKEMVVALRSCGTDIEEMKKWQCGNGELLLTEVLHSYGTYASIWEGVGKNIKKLMIAAKDEVGGAEMLFGFCMDRTVNRIGANGWDALRGNLWGSMARKEGPWVPSLAELDLIKFAEEILKPLKDKTAAYQKACGQEE